MNTVITIGKARFSFTTALYVIFLISVICAFRAVTSIFTGLILINGIVQQNNRMVNFRGTGSRKLVVLACSAYFFLQAVSLLFTSDINSGLHDIQLKSGLLFIPVAALLTVQLDGEQRDKLLRFYCVAIGAASLYLLIMALGAYRLEGKTGVFFYHALVKPFGYHAVYFSILVFVALVYLIENFRYKIPGIKPAFAVTLVIFLSLILILLSSKLVISFYLFYVFYFLYQWFRDSPTAKYIALGSMIILLTGGGFLLLKKNPVSERFRDLTKGNPVLATEDHFSPAVYFNGLQFRMLQWRLVPEILSERKRWWLGVTAGDAQAILNGAYLEKGMYHGGPGTKSRGYLDYNTHSELLESLFQNGIPGLTCYLVLCFSLVRLALQNKNRMLSFVIYLLLTYSLVESLFQQQYGIVLFTFLPQFACGHKPQVQSSKSPALIPQVI